MSQTREFDVTVTDAADLYVREYGDVDAAIEAIAECRREHELQGRAAEAIAYLRYDGGSV